MKKGGCLAVIANQFKSQKKIIIAQAHAKSIDGSSTSTITTYLQEVWRKESRRACKTPFFCRKWAFWAARPVQKKIFSFPWDSSFYTSCLVGNVIIVNYCSKEVKSGKRYCTDHYYIMNWVKPPLFLTTYKEPTVLCPLLATST